MLPSWSEALLGERASLGDRIARVAHRGRLPEDFYFPDPARRRKLARYRRAAERRATLAEFEAAIAGLGDVIAARVVGQIAPEAVHVVTEADAEVVAREVRALARALLGEAIADALERDDVLNVVQLRPAR